MTLFEAHPFTWWFLAAGFLVSPFYVLAVYVFSNASAKKGLILGTGWLVFGATMFCVCLFDANSKLGPLGNLLVPVAWVLPSAILVCVQNWALSQPLSQHWLVGLQLFRAIGGVFLIEMVRGNLAAIFAWPAGVGDLLVAALALVILLRYYRASVIPRKAVFLLIAFGVIDFLSAFFFGFFSSDTPFRIFHHEIACDPSTFPIGLIPLFLVPYAIFFHTLSFLNARKW